MAQFSCKFGFKTKQKQKQAFKENHKNTYKSPSQKKCFHYNHLCYKYV